MSDFRIDLSIDETPSPEVVRAVVEQLTDDEQTVVILSYAATMLPIADLDGRLRSFALLNEGWTLSELGRAVAKEIIRRDPEATDPHEREDGR